jgi:hypothetical protein
MAIRRLFVQDLLVYLTASMAALGHQFVIGPAGAAFDASAVPGYTLASFADIQSPRFLNSYNALGLAVRPRNLVGAACEALSVHHRPRRRCGGR